MGPEKTIDGSGLDPNDGHSTLETAMWLSAADTPLPAWIQYEFDVAYTLKEMWVWNSNQPMESLFGFGAKGVTVEYSTDGVKWTKRSDVEFAPAPGKAAYTHNTTVDLAGVTARHVRLTIQSNWGGLVQQTGLSEVRFFSSPAEETVVVDDFEGYTNDSPDRLWETWIDGIGYPGQAGNGSGAMVGHDIWGRGTPHTTIAETTIVHSGNQSMPLYYDNSKSPCYSEVERAFATPRDWLDANDLALWFRGLASNSPDSMSVRLQDSVGRNDAATHPDAQATLLEDWQQWKVPLATFATAGVDLQEVRSIRIGVGNRANPRPGGSGIVYVDDIEVRGGSPQPSGGGGHQSLPSDLVEVAGAPYASLDGLADGSASAQASQAQAVEQLRLPLEVKTAKTGIVLRLIPAGSFTMGSPTTEAGRESDEGPQHQVTLTKAFYCGKFEVTQGQWQAVMGSNPSYFTNAGLDAPVEVVSWDDCQQFLKKLSQMEGVPEGTYRLLTEAEWEYACRAGTETALYNGELVILGASNGPALDPIAYYGGNSGVEYAGGYSSGGWSEKQYSHTSAGTHPVGQKMPNAYGLCDMIGNVWEWCQDLYHSGYYSVSPASDPLGPAWGGYRVFRGGSWSGYARRCRSADRDGLTPDYRHFHVGFRLARTTPSYP